MNGTLTHRPMPLRHGFFPDVVNKNSILGCKLSGCIFNNFYYDKMFVMRLGVHSSYCAD